MLSERLSENVESVLAQNALTVLTIIHPGMDETSARKIEGR